MRIPAGSRHAFTLVALAAALAGGAAAAEAGLPRDISIRRPSQASFYADYNDNSTVDRIWGLGATTDVALLADVDGDTLADGVLYRGGAWFVDFRNDQTIDLSFILGGGADIPVAGDFLGTGRAGFGIFRPSDGLWYLDRNGDTTVDFIAPFGASGDVPVVADYDGDGRADRAVYRGGAWLVDLGLDSTLDAVHYLGGAPADIPVAGDFDGDWKADNAVFRNGVWFIDYGNNSTVDRVLSYGATGDRPLFAPLNPGSSIFVRAGAVGGLGTQAQPFGAIADALGMAAPGHVIRLSAGVFTEGICFASRQNLTFLGAGVAATHLRGANNNACNNAFDGFVAVASQGIVLRNLHVATNVGGCAVAATQCNRGIVALGIPGTPTTLTLDRVSTINNRGHGVLAVGAAASPNTLLVESCNLDRSRLGTGLRLEGGVSATVRRSTIDGNGTTLPVAADAGRGVEAFGDSSLLFELSSSSNNYHTALLFTGTSVAVVRNSTLNANGHSAIFFEQSSSGDVYGNVMDGNGTLGTSGPATGFNAIEVFTNWTGPQMLIHENTISRSTTNGIFIGRGASTVANNYFFNNFVGLTLYSETGPTSSTVVGNTFELPLAQGNEEGLFMMEAGSSLTASVGGAGSLRNTFINYVGNPSIHCNFGTEAPTCASGGNVFTNSNLPIVNCPGTCVP